MASEGKGEMNIRIAPVNKQSETQIDTLTSESYHLRVAVDTKNKQIRIPVIDLQGDIQLIVIDGVSPMLGHNKTGECCN